MKDFLLSVETKIAVPAGIAMAAGSYWLGLSGPAALASAAVVTFITWHIVCALMPDDDIAED